MEIYKRKSPFLVACLLSLILSSVAFSQENGNNPATALRTYIEKPDPSFHHEMRLEGEESGLLYSIITMTSQTWRGIVWRHQVYVFVPETVRDSSQALMVVAGGRWKDRYDEPITEKEERKFLSKMMLYKRIANMIQTPVVVVRHVPHQPIFQEATEDGDGLKEDAAIAYTFDQYMKTGDLESPLLLPMVKSAVRAMDVGQEVLLKKYNLDIATFTLMGASKRGWTTWLTSAIDSRVTALIPMVIDMLNTVPQMEHQQDAWGEPSEQIADYTRYDIPRRLKKDPRGGALVRMFDPYAYRLSLIQPKLIPLGTNDQYWPVDALNFYWDGLVGSKYILYLPNQGHKAADYKRLLASVKVMHEHAAFGRVLPQLEWKFTETDGELSVQVSSDIKPATIRVWQANSSDRDFRESRWRSHTIARKSSREYALSVPKNECRAYFIEIEYADRGWFLFIPYKKDKYSFSTTMRVVGPDRCLPTRLLEAKNKEQ